MQTLTEKIVQLSPPGGVFNETVMRNCFPKATDGARALLVSRSVEAGEVLRLKRGVFVLAAPWRKTEPPPFALAALLHSTSHVSAESALAFHGLIPEAVFQVVSVCRARSREFATPTLSRATARARASSWKSRTSRPSARRCKRRF